MNSMIFTLWDVGHGLSIWVKTPNGQNHWIDAGRNGDTDFNPAEHVRNQYHVSSLDFLILSHPDADHIHDLPNVIKYLGEPTSLYFNKSLPDALKYGNLSFEYQRVLQYLNNKYTSSTRWEVDPQNPANNGGIHIETHHLDYQKGMNINDTSIVSFYLFNRYLFIFPGDIEEQGWGKLWSQNSLLFTKYLMESNFRILVAPHHGRASGYSQQMFDHLDPHLVLISDKYGLNETDRRFRENASGANFNGQILKYLSTKSGGRIQFIIDASGNCTYHQV